MTGKKVKGFFSLLCTINTTVPPDPDHDCPFLPLAVAESAYLPLLFLRGRRRHSDASFRGINALLFARSPSPARPRAAIKCFCLRSTPCLPPRAQGN